MSDFLAGQTLTPLHFPPTVQDDQIDSYTFTITTLGVATTGGTYNTCGVAFVAPTTGRVEVFTTALLVNSGANTTAIAPVVREGAVVGSGTTFDAGDVTKEFATTTAAGGRGEVSHLVEGLTPGADYNVRLEHRVGAGTGTASRRRVRVRPAT